MNIFQNCIKLGNDIVDLSCPENIFKYLDKKFRARIFTENENTAIELSLEKDKILWSIWAAKEAAFKACQKKFSDIIFAHKKFSVSSASLTNLISYKSLNNQKITGILNYQSLQIAIEWQWIEDNVYCTSVLCAQNKIFQDWEFIATKIKTKEINLDINKLKCSFTKEELSSVFSDESLLTRYYAKQLLSQLGYNPSIEILRPRIVTKNSVRLGPPALRLQNKILSNCEISFSHDENWIGISICDNILDITKFGKYML